MQGGFETDKGNKIEKSLCKNFLDQRLPWSPPSIWSMVYFRTSNLVHESGDKKSPYSHVEHYRTP